MIHKILHTGHVYDVECYEAIVPIEDTISGEPALGHAVRASIAAERLADGPDYRGVRIAVEGPRLRWDAAARQLLAVVPFTTRSPQ